MYNQKFIAIIKSKGRVLRENKDIVYLPFSTEYSIFLKNLNFLRAVVSISIDDTDVLNGNKLVIDGNSELNLERFLTNNTEGRRFKFIERTQDIEKHRGIGVQDGLIHIEFQYEKQKPTYYTPIIYYQYWINPCENPWNKTMPWINPKQPYGPIWCSSDTNKITSSTNAVNMSVSSNILRDATMDNHTFDRNNVGITVEGSKSYQTFSTTFVGELEQEKHVIVLQLRGVDGDVHVKKPITVKTNKYCPSCGRNWPYKHEYCPKDGTFLKIK